MTSLRQESMKQCILSLKASPDYNYNCISNVPGSKFEQMPMLQLNKDLWYKDIDLKPFSTVCVAISLVVFILVDRIVLF